MVRGRARAFLAGPPLLKAATGEIATEEELGGAEMHTSVSGLGEYLAEDDRRRHPPGARDGGAICTGTRESGAGAAQRKPAAPRDSEDLLGMMPADGRTGRHARGHRAHRRRLRLPGIQGPVRRRHRVRPCAIEGHAAGHLSNNGPIDPDGATKATHFIQACCQSGTPLLYLQNTTGYMVGQAYERAA
jgi:geranyl-CoA carboxylase beta subunit